MRKTKIIATIGPASSDPSVFAAMCRAGVNVARLNFSHGTHEEQLAKIRMIQKVREELDLPIAIMLDTKGPEVRTGLLFDGKKVAVKTGDKIVVTAQPTSEDFHGTAEHISLDYLALPSEVEKGSLILIDDGLVALEVESVSGQDMTCVVKNDGLIGERKGVNMPNVNISLPAITERDRQDILFGLTANIDYIAASFIRDGESVRGIRKLCRENGGEHVTIFPKIECALGVENFDEILEASDGIMVARGDLGVEVPFTELPAIQKQLITTCRLLGTRVITATEMLESMIQNPRPTRAEISDVANAVYDGTSAIMLSGETAAGKYPVQAVETMAAIAEETEQHIHYETRFRNNKFQIRSLLDAISHATCGMAIDIGAKAIVVSSISGRTVRMVSRFRVPTDIVGMATSKAVWYKLALSWGVQPVLCEHFESTDVLFYHARKAAKQALHLVPGDRIVLTGGTVNGTSGNTNLIRVDTIQ